MQRIVIYNKRLLALLLLFAMMFMLCGCSDDDTDSASESKKNTPTSAPTSTSTPTPELSQEGFVIPDNLVGDWHGIGKPDGGGPDIDLTVHIKKDGTGSYSFEQDGYKENYDFSVSFTDTTFYVDIPEAYAKVFASCGGTWELKDGKLVLKISTKFGTGRVYSYTAECEKIEQ